MESPLLRSSVAAAQLALSAKPQNGKTESPMKSEIDGASTPSTTSATPVKGEVTVQKTSTLHVCMFKTWLYVEISIEKDTMFRYPAIF